LRYIIIIIKEVLYRERRGEERGRGKRERKEREESYKKVQSIT
jgi:hypothetical protein